MENYLALQAAAARPPLAVIQGHAMLRLVHRLPVTALEGAVTFQIGRFVRRAGAPRGPRRRREVAPLTSPRPHSLPSTRARD